MWHALDNPSLQDIHASSLIFCCAVGRSPQEWDSVERRACVRLFPGLFFWISPGCFRALKHLGFPSELPDFLYTAVATKCRVFRYEDRKAGGLRVSSRVAALKQSLFDGEYIGRRMLWSKWLDNTFLAQLSRAHSQLNRHTDKFLDMPGRQEDEVRRFLQHACYVVLRPPHAEQALRHLRRRLDRWTIDILSGRRVGRATCLLKGLAKVVPPRVSAAVLRVL